MKTYSEFISESRKRSSLSRDLSKLAVGVAKVGAHLAYKGAKAGAKALRNRWQDKPHGSKKRAVADVIDRVHWASLSDAEKTKRTNKKHKERLKREREIEKNQQRVDREVNKARREREKQHKPTQNKGRYRNVGAGRKESVTEQTPTMEPNYYSQQVAKRQAAQKTAHIAHVHRELGAEARAQQSQKRAVLKAIMSR